MSISYTLETYNLVLTFSKFSTPTVSQWESDICNVQWVYDVWKRVPSAVKFPKGASEEKSQPFQFYFSNPPAKKRGLGLLYSGHDSNTVCQTVKESFQWWKHHNRDILYLLYRWDSAEMEACEF